MVRAQFNCDNRGLVEAAKPRIARVVDGLFRERFRDHAEQRLPLGGGRDGEAFEIVAEAQIGMERAIVLVEMQERARAAIERSARFLLEAVQRAQPNEQRFELVEILRASVSHTSIEAGAGKNGKSAIRADTLRNEGVEKLGGRVSETTVPGAAATASIEASAIARLRVGE